jgi:hypothetical protein
VKPLQKTKRLFYWTALLKLKIIFWACPMKRGQENLFILFVLLAPSASWVGLYVPNPRAMFERIAAPENDPLCALRPCGFKNGTAGFPLPSLTLALRSSFRSRIKYFY